MSHISIEVANRIVQAQKQPLKNGEIKFSRPEFPNSSQGHIYYVPKAVEHDPIHLLDLLNPLQKNLLELPKTSPEYSLNFGYNGGGPQKTAEAILMFLYDDMEVVRSLSTPLYHEIVSMMNDGQKISVEDIYDWASKQALSQLSDDPTNPSPLKEFSNSDLVRELRDRGCAVALFTADDMPEDFDGDDYEQTFSEIRKDFEQDLVRVGFESLDTLVKRSMEEREEEHGPSPR